MGVKNPLITVKSGREKRFLPVKKIKNMAKNGFHAQNVFHAQKKKYWKLLLAHGRAAAQPTSMPFSLWQIGVYFLRVCRKFRISKLQHPLIVHGPWV